MKKNRSSGHSLLEKIEIELNQYSLEILGNFKTNQTDTDLTEIKTLILIGPSEPRFWKLFCTSKEYLDSKADPLDRWSKRIITKISKQINAEAFFPFGEKIWPFVSWATRCQGINTSPVKLLVHHKKGLFLSFRGALGVKETLKDKRKIDVCDNCSKPCLTACPVNALGKNGYDVNKCKTHVVSDFGEKCQSGCLVRTSCPIGSNLRLPEQSYFHMKSFLKTSLMA